eukprot:136767-Chlamydomonas_euryale.AAC.1
MHGSVASKAHAWESGLWGRMHGVGPGGCMHRSRAPGAACMEWGLGGACMGVCSPGVHAWECASRGACMGVRQQG